MKDTTDYITERKQLVLSLKKDGLTVNKVLQAIGKVPRHLFCHSALQQFAYNDMPLIIDDGQFISQPFAVAYQAELLEVTQGSKILEIGTGSGYSAAILAEMGADVFTLERNKKLHENAKGLLSLLGYKVNCFWADGYNGLAEFAPFDRIIVTTAPPYIPEALLVQLTLEGLLVIPVGAGEDKTMKQIRRVGIDSYVVKDCGKFR